MPWAIHVFSLVAVMIIVGLSRLVPVLLGRPGTWVDAFPMLGYVGVIMIMNLMYEGYLSIRTGITRTIRKRTLIRGRLAVVVGVVEIGLSIFVLVFLYATFGTSIFF